jgi:hypothetical protein
MYAAYLIGKLGGLEEYASVAEVKENYFEAIVLSMNINVKVYVNIVSFSLRNLKLIFDLAITYLFSLIESTKSRFTT